MRASYSHQFSAINDLNELITRISSYWISTTQLAKALSVPVKTIEHWRYSYENMPARKFGRHVRYNLAEVLEWQEKQFPSK